MATLPRLKTPIVEEEDQVELNRRKAYKPDMAKPEGDVNPFSQFLQDPMPAAKMSPAEPSLYERLKTNLRESVAGGMFEWGDRLEAAANTRTSERLQQEIKGLQDAGQGDTPEIQRKQQELLNAAFQSDQYTSMREEEKFQYENMPWSDTPLEWAASIGGGLIGSIDPTIAIGEVRVGTTAWRYGSPMISRMLDYGVTNAVTGAAMDAAAQSGDTALGIQDEIDWNQVALNGGIGFTLGAPFGYLSGKALRDDQAAERVLGHLMREKEPDAPPADTGPRADSDGPKVPDATPDQSTVESVSSKHATDDITAAQEAIFGEVVGTRNLTPEQLNQVDDYLNAGKPYDIDPPDAGVAIQAPEEAPQSINPAPLVARDYQDFRPEDLKVDAKRFQYKGGADDDGVVETLKKVKTWDRNKSGAIIVWQDKAGNNFVVDGHQRYGLAKRLKGEGQDPVLHAMIWKETDGVTADDARIMAADTNISQGSGTAIDAAKILRARPEFLSNLPNNQVTEHAKGLAELSDDAFGMVVNGAVPPEYAGIVGKLAANKDTHAQIMDVLAKSEPANAAQAESMVRDVLAAPEVEATMTDMFGAAEVTQILFKERSQVLSSAVAAIRKDRSAFNTLVKEEARLSGAGNKLETKTNLERTQTDGEILATLQATARRKGPVADALAAAAKSLHDGTPRQVAVRDFIDRIRGETGSASPDGEGLPPSSQSVAASLGGYRNTDQPAFKRWFGDSKVVDADGDPLVVYHGTAKAFDKVDLDKGAMGTFWFGSDRGVIERGEAGAISSREIMPLYAKIKKPAGWEEYDKYSVGELEARGYDGVILQEKDGSFTGFIWQPTQIKSIFNRGTWDSSDPRIAFSTTRKSGGFERGVDSKPQSILPGAERISDKTLAERRGNATLKPKANQKSMDFGLFGSEKDQMDLVDMVQRQSTLFKVKGEGDYLDFTPSGTIESANIGGVDLKYTARDGEVELISVRTRLQDRKTGLAKAALGEFLRKADDEGLVVRALVRPADKATTEDGLTKLLSSLGFTPSGRVAKEFIRRGPSAEDVNQRTLDDGLDSLTSLVDEGADIGEISSHPYILGAVRRMEALPLTESQPNFMSGPWKADRTYAFPGKEIKGYDNAVAELVEMAKDFSTNGLVRRDKKATIILGPPAAGKSTVAERFAAERHAAIVAPDESKKVIPEFSRGIGANAVHKESAIMASEVQTALMAQGANIVLPKVGGDVDSIRKLIERLKRNGYEVDLVNINVSYENAFRRMVRRFVKSGRLINPEYVKAVGVLPSETYRTLREQGVATRYAEIDGNGKQGEAPQVLDDTGATEGISGLGRSGEPSGRDGMASAGEKVQSPNIAYARRPQTSNMPVNRLQGGVPEQTKAIKADRLEDISEVLRSITGVPVRQGRLQRAPKGQKVAGQYDRDQGVIRLRDASDFDTQTHETAHSLETEWGRTLNTIKINHKTELEALAYANADPRAILSEGFAEWFRFYVTTPKYAANIAPKFTALFEKMLDAAPAQLAKIKNVQTRYVQWTKAPSAAVVSADIVSNIKGSALAEAIREHGGAREALGAFISKSYTATIDKLSPINQAVDELLKTYEKNTGKALNITSAMDPYRLARLLQDSYSAGHVDAMHGVVNYRGTISEGASLSGAITAALGSAWRGWDDISMADFAAYLVSRRSVQEYQRFLAGEIPNPPGKFTLGDYEVTIKELEAANPNYTQAADMVYQWGGNMLRKKYEAGFLTEKTYRELLQRKDYVPLMRDLRDLDKSGEGDGNKTLRNSILKAFKGSKRSVINPLESMMADAYQFNALLKRNDVFRALEDLGRMAGPGGGVIVERIPSTQLQGTTVNVDEVLRNAAKAAGLSPEDIDHITTFVDDIIGESATAKVFRPGDINEQGERIIYTWRDGKKQALRLADGEMGREMYNALTGMNKEASNLFVSALALPSTMVRYGVTTAPHFVLANYIRDQISAWVLTNDGFIPFVSGALGLRDELVQADVTRIYNSFGGIMGGGNVASLNKGRVKRDISALNKKGYHIKRFAGIQGFAEFTGLTETGTRLAIFKNSFKRSKEGGLTDYDSAVEAAYQARDYIDFGRHGSQTHTARRLVTFLNASLQGLDKTFRVLTGEGSIKKAIAPYVNHRAGRPLSVRDKQNIAKAASAWTKMTAIGVFGLSLSYLYADDPEYGEISDHLRATHWMVKKGPGEWYAIPKPFELGFVSNLFERGFDSVYGRNPIAMQSFLSGLYEVTAPPMGIALFETMYEMKHNKNGMGSDIVGRDIAGFEPWRRYTAQTSEIAKAMGAAVNISPAMIDHAIQGFGASWGKIITDASTARAQGRSETDILMGSITNRFVRDVTRGATSTRQFWELMSESTGPLVQAATTYKDEFENAGPAAAEQMLASKDENTKAYALIETHFKTEVRHLHPMNRAKDAMAVISKMRREIAGNDIAAIEDEETKIALVPTHRQMAQEFLSKISMIEARNALIVSEVPGWNQKELMETKSLYEDLRSTSPELADELEARMTKKKVYDFDMVRENWPDVKERLLQDRQEADFSDMTAGME